MSFVKSIRLAAVAVLLFGVTTSAPAALITFSGLNNGINTSTDPDNTSTGTPIPAGYQPLQNAYSAPGGNVDGANIGITIDWGGTSVASQSFGGVSDHTHTITPSDTAGTLGYDSGAGMDLKFSAAVDIASFYYANFGGSPPQGFNIRFQGYTNPGDATPAIDISHTYFQTTGPNGGGYQWILETGLAGVPIRELIISGDNYKQTDDWTINAVPEPGSLALLGLGTAGLMLAARRRRSA